MESHKIWKFDHDVDTDQIIPSQYLLLPTVDDMKSHTFESFRPELVSRFNAGDVIVAGKNFGCGSSREQAPRVLQAIGTAAVVAQSFARIFFRNSINVGLPLLVCPELYQRVKEGDSLSFSFEKGEIYHGDTLYRFQTFPEHLRKIIDRGGLINYLNSQDED